MFSCQRRLSFALFSFTTVWLLCSSQGLAGRLTGYSNAPAYEGAVPQVAADYGSVTVYSLDDTAPVAAMPVPAPVSVPEENYVPSSHPALDRNKPVDLSADDLRHDDMTGTITASGNVVLQQSGRILRADMVSYNMNTDTVIARGNVSLTEPSGNVHFADEVQLSDELRNGFVSSLQSYLSQGGHFTAEEGQRINEKLIKMRNASYTPCDCETDNDGNPAWQIKAEELTLDEENHKVKYKNARVEIFGVPVAWTPYLAHSDGKEERKSGFLSPQVGYDSTLGLTVAENYYWDIAPNRDATIGTMVMTKEAPVALGQYRHRFEQAEIQVDGSATYSNRKDQVAGQEVLTKEEFRGHLFADGQWSINEKWRSGLNVEVTTDDQYLRQYDFSGKDVLENELYAERFSGRNYAVGRLLAFQDVRVEEDRTDQPNVLPEVSANFIGEPNALLGGRWEAQVSTLQLQRNRGQDMTRLVGKLGWQRRDVLRSGIVNTVDLSLRGDAYHVSDRDPTPATANGSDSGSDTRFLPQAHMLTRYPLVKPMAKMQAVIEPVAALTLAPNINDVDSDIPNEDSNDVQVDASNIFEPNRFPGEDRLEDRSRLTYGMRTGLYGYGGSYGDVFIGQSYRFDDHDNPFPGGSGLNRQESDWVGQFSGVYDDRYGLNYRFQLDGRNFASRRHEVDGYANFGRLNLSSRYLFADLLEGTDIRESREQIYGGASYKLTNNWRVRGSVLEDLGEDPGLREATFGFDYLGCCMSFSATVERHITSDISGDSGTDIKFRVGLKGLGEFQSSQSGAVNASNKN